MPANKIAFANLRAEMARNGMKVENVAKALEIDRSAMSKKLSMKMKLSAQEIFSIKQRLFPDENVEYLFEELLDDKKAPNTGKLNGTFSIV